ncbi:hypothetical protein HK098_006378 [Nowakowskiella sp. JEL0407]|nr:hypothetical protein HK098_006378 [Nowakowskiella sp. JEL0407]
MYWKVLAPQIREKKQLVWRTTALSEVINRSKNLKIAPPDFTIPICNNEKNFRCEVIVPSGFHEKLIPPPFSFIGKGKTAQDAKLHAAFKAYNFFKNIADLGISQYIGESILDNLAIELYDIQREELKRKGENSLQVQEVKRKVTKNLKLRLFLDKLLSIIGNLRAIFNFSSKNPTNRKHNMKTLPHRQIFFSES